MNTRPSPTLLLCTLLPLLAVVSLSAQDKATPASPLSAHLAVPGPPPVSKVSIGQTQQEVIKMMGRPTKYQLDHVKGVAWPSIGIIATGHPCRDIPEEHREILGIHLFTIGPACSISQRRPGRRPMITRGHQLQHLYNPSLSRHNDDGTWSMGGGPVKKVNIGKLRKRCSEHLGDQMVASQPTHAGSRAGGGLDWSLDDSATRHARCGVSGECRRLILARGH